MYVACRLHKPSIDLIKPRLSPLAISVSLSSSHSLARLERSTIEKVQATISQKPAKKKLDSQIGQNAMRWFNAFLFLIFLIFATVCCALISVAFCSKSVISKMNESKKITNYICRKRWKTKLATNAKLGKRKSEISVQTTASASALLACNSFAMPSPALRPPSPLSSNFLACSGSWSCPILLLSFVRLWRRLCGAGDGAISRLKRLGRC